MVLRKSHKDSWQPTFWNFVNSYNHIVGTGPYICTWHEIPGDLAKYLGFMVCELPYIHPRTHTRAHRGSPVSAVVPHGIWPSPRAEIVRSVAEVFVPTVVKSAFTGSGNTIATSRVCVRCVCQVSILQNMLISTEVYFQTRKQFENNVKGFRTAGSILCSKRTRGKIRDEGELNEVSASLETYPR